MDTFATSVFDCSKPPSTHDLVFTLSSQCAFWQKEKSPKLGRSSSTLPSVEVGFPRVLHVCPLACRDIMTSTDHPCLLWARCYLRSSPSFSPRTCVCMCCCSYYMLCIDVYSLSFSRHWRVCAAEKQYVSKHLSRIFLSIYELCFLIRLRISNKKTPTLDPWMQLIKHIHFNV